MAAKVLYLSLYPTDTAPSQRFRVEQYLPYWETAGVQVDLLPFYDYRTFSILYKQGNTAKKAWRVFLCFLKRLTLFFKLPRYDFIWVQRSVTPIGPPIIEWIVTKIFRKKLIYDFDDAIWVADPETSPLVRWLKSYHKVENICSWAYKVCVGNGYLADYARKYNDNVFIIPTVVDTQKRYFPRSSSREDIVVIGWTGSHSTIRHLELVKDSLLKLSETLNFKFVIISNGFPNWNLPHQSNIQWSKTSEIEDLEQFDIGIMPLVKDAWSKGKCGFKAIQYMALGIPAIVSPVGVNTQIVEHNKNGYLANNEEEWLAYLKQLIQDEAKRKELGKAARKAIENNYSVHAQLEATLALFDV